MSGASVKDSNAAKIRKRILSSQNRFWEADEFQGSRRVISKSLGRLADSGDITRLRRGLYWRGPQDPDPEQTLNRLTGCPAIGPAAESAIAVLLGEPPPHPIQLAIPERAPTGAPPSMAVIDRSSHWARRYRRLNRWEVALLEMLDFYPKAEPSHQKKLSESLSDLVSDSPDRFRPSKLAAAAETESASVRAGLIALFNEIGEQKRASSIEAPFSTKTISLAYGGSAGETDDKAAIGETAAAEKAASVAK